MGSSSVNGSCVCVACLLTAAGCVLSFEPQAQLDASVDGSVGDASGGPFLRVTTASPRVVEGARVEIVAETHDEAIEVQWRQPRGPTISLPEGPTLRFTAPDLGVGVEEETYEFCGAASAGAWSDEACVSVVVAPRPLIAGLTLGPAIRTRAGRGGTILRVSTLADSGPGSLREALSQGGSRTIVFEIGGAIELESPLRIEEGNVRVAGQSAPDPGIHLHGQLEIDASDVAIEHVSVRGESEGIALSVGTGVSGAPLVERVVLSHITVSWGRPWNIVVRRSDFVGSVRLHRVLSFQAIPDGGTASSQSWGLITRNAPWIQVDGSYISSSGQPVRFTPQAGRFLESVVYNQVTAGLSVAQWEDTPVQVDLWSNVLASGGDSQEGSSSLSVSARDPSRVFFNSHVIDGGVFDDVWATLDDRSARIDEPSLNALEVLAAGDVVTNVVGRVGSRPRERQDCPATGHAAACLDAEELAAFESGEARVLGAGSSPDGPTLTPTERSFVAPANPNEDTDGNGYTELEDQLAAASAALLP